MIKKIKLWWRVKRWKLEEHSDCVMFLGPCDICQERLRDLAPGGMRAL